MTNKTKWIVGTALVLVIVLLAAIFWKNLWNGVETVLLDAAIYAIVFAAGWLVGRFAGRGRQQNR